MSRSRFALSALAAAMLAVPSLQAVELQSIPGTDTKLQVYGFVMVYGNLFFGGTQPDSPNTASSMFYEKNPLDQTGLQTGTFNMSYAPSRYGFASTTPSAALGDISTKIEYDLNSSSSHLRHAYIKFGGWTIGKAWSLWNDLDAGADTVDWAGPIGSACYDTPRLVEVQYNMSLDKHNAIGFSIEQNTGNSDGSYNTGGLGAPSSKIPSFVAAYTYTGDWGHIGVRGLAQNYGEYIAATDQYYSKIECGAQVSGQFNIAKDSLIFSVMTGNGLGQYGNGFQSVLFDDVNQKITALSSTGWLAGYTHNWNDAVRSNLIASGTIFQSDNSSPLLDAGTNSTNGPLMKTMSNVFVNTIVKLSKTTELGFEYVYETAKGFGQNVAFKTDGSATGSASDSKFEVALTAHF